MPSVPATVLPAPRRPKSQHEKHRKAFSIAQRLAAHASEATGVLFDMCLRQMQQLEDEWKHNLPVRSGPSTAAVLLGPSIADEVIPDPSSAVERSGPSTSAVLLGPSIADEVIPDPSPAVKRSGPLTAAERPCLSTAAEKPGPSTAAERPGSSSITLSATSGQQQAISMLIDDVTLPPPVKRRGRPRGGEMTVIGLPKKRKIAARPVPFIRKSPQDKEASTY